MTKVLILTSSCHALCEISILPYKPFKFCWINAKGGGSEWKLHRSMFSIYVENHIEGKTGNNPSQGLRPRKLRCRNHNNHWLFFYLKICPFFMFSCCVAFFLLPKCRRYLWKVCFLSCSWWDPLSWQWGCGCALTPRLYLCSTAIKHQTRFLLVSTSRMWAGARTLYGCATAAYLDQKRILKKPEKVQQKVGTP